MDTLLLKKCWILVTGMKNMNCAADMLDCIQKLEGKRWDKETKKRYFANLIQRGIVSPEYNRLSRRAESPFEERQCNRGAGHEMDRRAVSGQFSHPCLCAVSDQAGTGEDRL